jgi:excisionase family DNA binding protein
MTFSSGEAARMLGVSRTTIKRYEKAGRLQGFLTPGKQHRFDAEEIERLRSGGPPELREACPHKRWVRCLLVALDGHLDRVKSALVDMKMPVPDLMAVKMEVLQAMSEEARKRAESGGPWLHTIKDDAAWLERAEIKFIVDVLAGDRHNSPGRLANIEKTKRGRMQAWSWLLSPCRFEERIALETLLVAGQLTRYEAAYKFSQHWMSEVKSEDVDAFVKAAYDLEAVDQASYLATLPGWERELKERALGAAPEVVLAMLGKYVYLSAADFYGNMLILAADRLDREIVSGDAREIASLLSTVCRLEQQFESAMGMRSRLKGAAWALSGQKPAGCMPQK